MPEQKVITTVTLSEFMGGALEEDFQRAFTDVIANIYDPNADSKVREINIKLVFKPGSNGFIETKGQAIAKLRPSTPLEGGLFSGKVKGGRITVHEHVVAQGELDLDVVGETSEQVA